MNAALSKQFAQIKNDTYHRVPQTTAEDFYDWTQPVAQGKDPTPRDLEGGNEESHIDRQKRRLAELKTTVFDTYAICAALLASFACSTSFIGEAELLRESPYRRLCVQVQQILVRICIIGAIHAMLVFMFCALYAKSALARESFALALYDRFSAQTGAIRQTAFWSMYYTAILYSIQIAMSTFYSLSATPAFICSCLIFALIGRVVWDAQAAIKAAGCVFMSDDQIKAMLEESGEG